MHKEGYAAYPEWRKNNPPSFKVGDKVVYKKLVGYEWVEDLIDTDLLQTVTRVETLDGSVVLGLEDIRTRGHNIPAFCFDFDYL